MLSRCTVWLQSQLCMQMDYSTTWYMLTVYGRNIYLAWWYLFLRLPWDGFKSFKEWVRLRKIYQKQRLVGTVSPFFYMLAQSFLLFSTFEAWSYCFLYGKVFATSVPQPQLVRSIQSLWTNSLGRSSWWQHRITPSYYLFKQFLINVLSVNTSHSLWLTISLKAGMIFSYPHITDKSFHSFCTEKKYLLGYISLI